MTVSQNLLEIRKHISQNVQLVCVTKFHSDETILKAYHVGERIFGESRVQELLDKQPRLPQDIHWHFIGHLQRNKVKFIAPFIELIHGVDSLRLLAEINKQASDNKRIINCLLQIHIADEETKFGFSDTELLDVYASDALSEYKSVRICGLMGMATFTENQAQVRKEFQKLKTLFDAVKSTYEADNEFFKEISMGMSDDYQIGIEEGSTMVRIGSSIFGEREY